MVRRIGLIVACLAVAGPIRCCAFLPPWQNDIVHDNRRSALTADLTSASVDAITNNTALILSEVQTYQNPRYTRKPLGYWKSIDNIRKEFTLFWNELNVPIQEINPGEPPPIPSNFILVFFKRHDLRGVLLTNGGREHVSYLLGGAKLIPPKWKDAVELEEVKRLLPLMNNENANEEVPHQQATESIEVEAIDRGGNEQLRFIDLVRDPVVKRSKTWTKERTVLEL